MEGGTGLKKRSTRLLLTTATLVRFGLSCWWACLVGFEGLLGGGHNGRSASWGDFLGCPPPVPGGGTPALGATGMAHSPQVPLEGGLGVRGPPFPPWGCLVVGAKGEMREGYPVGRGCWTWLRHCHTHPLSANLATFALPFAFLEVSLVCDFCQLHRNSNGHKVLSYL